MFESFHFLRPGWLLALPLAWWLIYRWRGSWQASPWVRVIDEALLPHLLGEAAQVSRRWPLWLAGLAVTLGLLALAGPAWQQLPQPVYSSPAHRVLVMDLSAPMNAADIKPSRLQRARLTAHQLLASQDEGETALVAFAGSAFPVVPLTRDDATVGHLLDSLSTDLMPVPGQNIAAGIRQATELLGNARATQADIVLLTASTVDKAARRAVRDARAAGYRVHVLAAGTQRGAPVPAPGGGWHKDDAGGIRLARIDAAALQDLAQLGGGRYARVDGIDAQWSLQPPGGWQMDAARDQELRADIWRDEGPWLLLPLLLVAALGFRRGWLMLWLLALPLAAPTPAQAEWWRNDDQVGHALLQQGEAQAAADTFRSRRWRATALHEAGDYTAAAELWARGDSAEDAYNRGNALARAGQLEQALAAYDQALQRRPEFPRAQHNRQLIEDLLKRQQEQQQQQGEGGEQSESPQQDAPPPDGQDQQAGDPSQPQGQPSAPEQQDARQQDQQGEPSEQQAEAESRQSAAGDDPTDEPPQGEQNARAADPDAEAPDEQAQAVRQWLNRLPDDPGRLLRNKFQRMQERRAQRGEDEAAW